MPGMVKTQYELIASGLKKGLDQIDASTTNETLIAFRHEGAETVIDNLIAALVAADPKFDKAKFYTCLDWELEETPGT